MSAGWKIFWLATLVFTIAVGIGHVLVPGIVPIAFAEEPQASWAIMTAFLLRAIELTAAWVAILSLSITLGVALRGCWRRRLTL
ncbi:hypothetical protein [Bradyrhizobium iriomotense]|uniref:Uncharacterized protein n=1 Tax=Bradyrhizobium iriomotense TaxID=441950 RepID=A0ABQ6BCR7_9BRAD|nr:hypothetical protein [Bradyrhizobium iriomotense]GLR91873.1 hypothetical protein GCM10007857_85910 [Bradyrhizobium iriomotense]